MEFEGDLMRQQAAMQMTCLILLPHCKLLHQSVHENLVHMRHKSTVVGQPDQDIECRPGTRALGKSTVRRMIQD